MKCPNCGTENTDNHKFCFECAHPLFSETPESEPQDLEESSVKSELDIENIENEEVVETEETEYPEAKQRPLNKTTQEILHNLFDDDDDDSEDLEETEPEQSEEEEEDIDEEDEEYEYDENDDEEDERQSRKQRRAMTEAKKDSRKKNKQEKSGNAPFIFVTFILIILIAALFYAYLKKEYDGSFGLLVANVFGTNPITASATITEDETTDGEPALLITVYAKKGYIVSFEEGSTQKEAVVTGHYVSFRVPQSLWIPQDASESNQISIVPTVFVKDPNTNVITQVEFTPFVIQIPSVTITILLPETLTFVTSSSTVEIAGYVSDVTASVFMGDTQLQTDANGYFRGIYHIDKLGVSNLVIEARKAGYAVGSAVINITYTKSEINLTITNDTMRTFTDTIEIKGTMDQGATLSVSGVEVDGDIKINDDGTFSFIAKVPEVGLYTPKLTVSHGEITSSVDIFIEHAPNLDEYIQSAWALDYQWMLEHPTMQRHFGFSCKVVEIIQAEPFVIAKVRTDNGDLIVYYYHTTLVEANDGKNYRMYAFLDGKDLETGLPIMYCWFIYKS